MNFTDRAAEGKVTEIKDRMEQWLSELPPRLQLGNLNPEQKSFRGAVHLHMNWNQITIYMGRAALLGRIQRYLHRLRDGHQANTKSKSGYGNENVTGGRSDENGHFDNNNDAPPELREARESKQSDRQSYELAAEAKLSRQCVSAAYNITGLIRHLHDVGKLARFSFTDMNCCCTAAIIIMIYEIIHRHPLFASSITAALQAMGVMASGCQNARYALKLTRNILATTNAIKGKYPELPSDPAYPDADDDADVGAATAGDERRNAAASMTAGYEQWEAWMAEAENWGTASARDRAAEASRLAMASESTVEGWRMDTPGSASAIAHPLGVAGPAGDEAEGLGTGIAGGYGLIEPHAADYGSWMGGSIPQTGPLGAPIYPWPEHLSSLGLSGFGGLEFPDI